MFREKSQGKRIKRFVVILTYHRTWGLILLPCVVEREINGRFYTITDYLSPYPRADMMDFLSPEEREIVRLVNDYSEKQLYRLFSKEVNTRKFVETLSKDKLDNVIRPYIEGKMFRVLTIMRDEGTPLLSQRLKSSNFHEDDVMVICNASAEGLFKFVRTSEGTRYSLSIFVGDEELILFNSGTEIITSSPCIIRYGNRVVFIQSLDAAKLRPFITREFINIPPGAEEKYYSSFVLNTVTSHKVEASGFDILDGRPEKKPLLLLESGFSGSPVLIMSFSYSGTVFFQDDPVNTFTKFENRNGSFILTRFPRDKEWEEQCMAILEDQGFFSDDSIHYTVFRGGSTQNDELYSLIEAINRSYDELVNAGFELRLGNADRKYILSNIGLETDISTDNDWFDIKVVVTIGDQCIPFTRFHRHILNGIREYELPDGRVMILPEAWFTVYHDIFGLGKIEKDILKIHKQHYPLINEAMVKGRVSGHSDLEALVMPGALPDEPLPQGLATRLRSYQIEGFKWMLFLQANKLGGCLADDMGLGKTVQTLAVLLRNREFHQAETAKIVTNSPTSLPDLFSETNRRLTNLVIVPASLLHNWENEIRTHTPSLRVYSYKGAGRRKTSSYFPYYDIILSSYHTIRQDADILTDYMFNYIVLDESQMIKNPASAVYKAISGLSSNHKMVLTGTPVENSLTDLWTQMNFINPGLLGSLYYFKKEFAGPVEKNNDLRKEEKLKAIIKPFILRRTKEMVASDLPPVWEQMVFCDMTDGQAELYEREKSAVRNSILGSPGEARDDSQTIMVLQGLMRLRQIANHPLMVADDWENGSGKYDILLHDIKSVISEGHKILIFSSFVKHLRLFTGALTKANIGYTMLTGSTVNREEVVRRFQNDSTCEVFLISLKAGGVGLNLTAADYVFILDPWWNPAAEMQALSRAHRIGQEKSVFVFRYVSAGTIEEKIIRLQEKKSKLADTFINSSNPLKDMDVTQILEIID